MCEINRAFPTHDLLYLFHRIVLESVVAKIALVTHSFGLKVSAGVQSPLSPINPSWHAILM
jgi:hypothetical protein